MLAWRSGFLVIIISFLASVSWAQSPYKFADENKILMIDLNELKKSGNEKSAQAENTFHTQYGKYSASEKEIGEVSPDLYCR